VRILTPPSPARVEPVASTSTRIHSSVEQGISVPSQVAQYPDARFICAVTKCPRLLEYIVESDRRCLTLYTNKIFVRPRPRGRAPLNVAYFGSRFVTPNIMSQHNEPTQVTRELCELSAETSSARAHSIIIAYTRHNRIQYRRWGCYSLLILCS
jgi:hypothetical protein